MSKNCKNCITADDVGGALAVIVLVFIVGLTGFLIGRTSDYDMDNIKDKAFNCGRVYHDRLFYSKSLCER